VSKPRTWRCCSRRILCGLGSTICRTWTATCTRLLSKLRVSILPLVMSVYADWQVPQATGILSVVRKDSTLGLSFILQLTGVHGNQQFDKLTRTKTVESILSTMTAEGIKHYIAHLLEQTDGGPASKQYGVRPFQTLTITHSEPGSMFRSSMRVAYGSLNNSRPSFVMVQFPRVMTGYSWSWIGSSFTGFSL
jgi:hypothetical protein